MQKLSSKHYFPPFYRPIVSPHLVFPSLLISNPLNSISNFDRRRTSVTTSTEKDVHSSPVESWSFTLGQRPGRSMVVWTRTGNVLIFFCQKNFCNFLNKQEQILSIDLRQGIYTKKIYWKRSLFILNFKGEKRHIIMCYIIWTQQISHFDFKMKWNLYLSAHDFKLGYFIQGGPTPK